MKKSIGLFTLLFSCSSFLFAQTLVNKINPVNDYDIAYEEWQLDNGLTLIIHEDHSDPIVHIEMTYHVGSNREQIGMTGFAHFFEHMMFQGSDNVADEEHFKIVSESGGTLNGTTNRDRTNYFETLPSNQLETALWLESDRMGFFLDAVTDKKFENQRNAVKNEKSQNQINVPYGMLYEVMGQVLYPKGHPYSWPTIGYVDDLDRVTVDELKEFFMRWYGPNNAYLVISGDVDPTNVVELVNKYFGSIPRGQEVRNLRKEKVILAQNKYKKFADRIYFPLAAFIYPTVPNYHRDEPALDALADMMGGGNNSPFYKSFVKTEKAVDASVSHPCAELSGEFMISVVSYPNFTFAETEEEVNTLLNDFEANITDEALDRFKSKMRSNIIDGLSSVAGKASQLTSWAYLLDEPYNFSDDINRYQNITRQDVIKVYKKYIKNKNSVAIDYFPLPPASEDSVRSINPYANVPFQKDPQYDGLSYNKPTDSFDRGARPVAGPAKAVNVPVYFEKNISNAESNYNIPVIGAESNEVPKVYLLITLEGGDLLIADEIKKAGLPELTASMLNEGTENYSTEEISSMLDDLGSSIRFSSDSRTSTIFVTSLVGNLDKTIEILKEKLFMPGFRAEDFKRVNKQYRESINNSKKSANNMASQAMAGLLYGKTIRGISPSVKGVEKLKLQDVKDFYRKQYNPNLASLVVVGDVTQEAIMPQLSFLNNWKGDKISFNKVLPVEEINGRTVHLVHKPGPQSIIILGHHALKYDTEGEYFKANVMNFVFGGAFNSRLNLNLREDKGFTYGIRSGFNGDENDGVFYIQSSVRSEATDSALTEIYLEMNNYLSNGITESELEFTKSAIINSDALKYETAFQKSRFLARIQRYGLDREFTKRQNQIINNITVEEINALAKKHIDQNNHAVVVVGNKYALKKSLAKFGKVEELKIK